MPKQEDISEEGFGYFRGTWFIGGVHVADANAVVCKEGEMIEALDHLASDREQFELLATALDHQELDGLPSGLRSRAVEQGFAQLIREEDELHPIGGLEVGVAGLTHALSAVRCLTAASCRSHEGSRTWSEHPVVFFAAPAWRVGVLTAMIAAEDCGLGTDRGMLTIYARSVRETHALARRVLDEREGFHRTPEGTARRRSPRGPKHAQLRLPDVP